MAFWDNREKQKEQRTAGDAAIRQLHTRLDEIGSDIKKSLNKLDIILVKLDKDHIEVIDGKNETLEDHVEVIEY